jgi:hypothetical protein
MAAQRFEYKVVYVDFRGRISAEGDEVDSRGRRFGRRVLNSLGCRRTVVQSSAHGRGVPSSSARSGTGPRTGETDQGQTTPL